jgi:hypothetical protein
VWDQQILLLWILLTPVFVVCTLLAFAAPLFFRDRGVEDADSDVSADPHGAITETVDRKAA